MKFTVCGDPHATTKNINKINELFDIFEEISNPVIILGDLLDTKSVVRSECLNLYYRRLKSSILNYIILVGNHDFHNLQCEDHSLQVLKELPNVTIVDKPTLCYDMLFLPYNHDPKTIKKWLKDTEAKTVFGHFDICGFDYGNGFMCEEGLSVKDFKKFDLVVSGHFHKFQQQDNLVYLGTPFSHSFGESNQDKYIAIFDKDKKIDNDNEPHLCNGLKLIRTPFPSHVTIEIDCDDENPNMLGYQENDIVRVIYKGSKENIEIRKNKSQFPEGTKIIEKPNDEYANNTVIDETLDNVVKFQQFANDVKQLDDETVKLGTQILEGLRD